MSGKTDTWMPLYIGDYLADTQHLSTVEHGAYLLLLMTYWRIKGPLPDDDVKLARMARLPLRQWKAMRSTIVEFFQIGDGQLKSSRADKEIEAARVKSEKARANALERHKGKGADAEPPHSGRNADGGAESMLTGTSAPASPLPSPSPDPVDHKKPSTKASRVKKPLRFFVEDEPLDPDFYSVVIEYPGIDPQELWETCRDWHLRKCEGTGSIKATAHTFAKRELKNRSTPNLRVVR